MNQTGNQASLHVPKIFVVCDQEETAPVWGYILRQKGLIVILETSLEKAIEHWSREMPDLLVLDVDISHQDCMELYKMFQGVCLAPILLFLPNHHETQILEAYAAGVDDVVVKPVSPAIFLAKIMAWVRHSWTVPVDGLCFVQIGKHRLDPTRPCLIAPTGSETNLTNLEFHLLHLLMSRPGHVFNTEDIIQTLWGDYGNGDPSMLKNVVYRLRKKIEVDSGNPVLLQTGQGGYSFQE